MKISIAMTGRKAGAIGIFYPIGSFEGEGATPQEAVDAARQAAYKAGFEHVQPAQYRLTAPVKPLLFGGFSSGDPVPVYTEIQP